MRSLRLLVPANIRHNSGGNVYNARLAQGLRALGVEVEVIAADGSWPEATAKERRRLGGLLGAWGPQAEITAGTVTLVDGLIACGAPDELEYAAAARRQTWVLLHMPSASHPGNEARSLSAATGVICTSTSAAAGITSLHGLTDSHVALPGTDPAPVAEGSDPPHIIAVAALLPNKDQLLTVEALARLQDHAWTASLVGSDHADPEYAELVRAAVAGHGLEDRIRLMGQLTGAPLDAEWNRADLSLLVSKAEAFGLVVTESLARGIPVIIRDGTGAVEALAFGSLAAGETDVRDGMLPGAAVDLSSNPAEGLAGAIRQWLEEAGLHTGWRAAALAARENLPGWETTARTVMDIVGAPPKERLPQPGPPVDNEA
ncbi:glycosyltransferase involved in cell wall biosynthesis [Arthrobacter pascens]|uniref:glycosyltransferase family 4 protein n=1 Tax=Arthrobacter pascens TaxID=1677 RepID=UPI00278DD86C|nr:glycosyltransferase family 4 protein [Arthrobacter pascens]MDQ0680074.1 glycosyltransferase involved in cell wall biosynthesis [Arthrobacter pascens]